MGFPGKSQPKFGLLGQILAEGSPGTPLGPELIAKVRNIR